MNLEELKTCVEGDILDLSHRELSSQDVEGIIHLVLAHWPEFETTISTIDFSHNNMKEIPAGFLELCERLDEKNLDRLDFYGNSFQDLTVEDAISIFQAMESSGAVSMHFFDDDQISRARFQMMMHNSLYEHIAQIDPDKNQNKQEVALTLVEYAKNLIVEYAAQVNQVHAHDEDSKLQALINFTAKDAYEFNPQFQIAAVMEQYYNPRPDTASRKKARV